MAITRDHDVVGFKIAMHDSCRVSFRQSFGDLVQESEQDLQFSFLAVNLSRKSLAIDKLHRDEVRAVALANLVDVRDVWMIERGRRFRFLNETAHAVLIRGKISGQNLHRHFAIEFRVLGQIDLTHSARADLRDDAVVRQSGIGWQCLTHLVQLRRKPSPIEQPLEARVIAQCIEAWVRP